MTLQMMFFLLIDTIMILFVYKKMMYSVESNRLPDLQKKMCLIEKEKKNWIQLEMVRRR